MATGLKPPFDYSNILIGEEVIYRGLNQQEDNAKSDKFGQVWSNTDRIEQSSMFFKSSVLRNDFDLTGFEHCLPQPPCPWPKEDEEPEKQDDIPQSLFKDIVMSNDGIFSYKFEVLSRSNSQTEIEPGDLLFDYQINQTKLDPDYQSEFSYLTKNGSTDYKGKAVIRIQRRHRGEVDQIFYYVFDLV